MPSEPTRRISLHTAAELRQLWKPLRDSYAQAHLYESTRVRLHRAFTWLEAAESAASADHSLRLLAAWSALLAMASKWDQSTHAPERPEVSLPSFLSSLRRVDHDGVLHELVALRGPSLQAMVNDSYIAGVMGAAGTTPGTSPTRGAPDLLDRATRVIAVVWRQVAEGGTAHDSAPMREVLSRCAAVTLDLALAAIQIVTHHGYAENWGPLCYPPTGGSSEAPCTSRGGPASTAWAVSVAVATAVLVASTSMAAPDAGGVEPSSAGEAMQAWGRLIGRLHLLVLHFPLALVLVAVGAECWRVMRRVPGLSPLTPPLVAIGAAASVVAVVTGWFFAANDGDDGSSTLFLHRWGGTACAALLLWLWWETRRCARVSEAAVDHGIRAGGAGGCTRTRCILAAAGVMIAGVGYFGGEMVHGDGFVEEALERALRETFDGEESPRARGDSIPQGSAQLVASEQHAGSSPGVVDFARDIQPILAERCVECHGPKKKKGQLSFDPVTDALAWRPKSGSGPLVIEPGFPGRSLMIERVQLPADHEDAMPQGGERLTPAQVEVLKAWIAGGALVPQRAEAPTDLASPPVAARDPAPAVPPAP
ncbi:MAG: hypothetical protein O2819_06910 [Planctomycetota bacterium]|nr:hypothetical protein [Planctomycetota bacterium]MDA1105186.1 hypothetical protein [Planctomycetota bacterium]